MTEEEKKRLYGPEKGHYNADAEVYEDLNAAAAEKAQADADLAAAQADLNAAREDHPMLDANKQPQVVTTPTVQPTTVATPATTPTLTAPASATVTAPAETTVDQSDAPVYNAVQTPAEGDLAAAQAAYDKAEQETLKAVQDENAARNKSFADMVNDYYAEKKRQEDEMKQREQANMMSSMATGTTELAANIINMLSVGGLHANNQQYKSYSQDWMRKADQDIREHRHRRDNLNNTLMRLKQQQEQVRTAGRIEEMKMRQQQAADAYNRALRNAQDAERRADKEWEKDFKERTQERQAKQTDASIAQGWARIQQQRDANTTSMLAQGWVPDKKAPGGFRYDPKAAEKYGVKPSSSSSSSRSGSGSSSTDDFPVIDSNGDVNIAKLRPHEVEYLRDNAREAIKKDLGPEESMQFEKEFRRAMDDKGRNAVLSKWMGRSKTCEEIIRSMDADYSGRHGERQSQQPQNNAGYARGKSSQDLINAL